MDYAHQISRETGLEEKGVAGVVRLLEEGATIWFIARYRKEVSGSMDEVAVTRVRDRLDQLKKLLERRQAIVKSLADRDLLTPELSVALEKASTLTDLEDIYEAFRPKKETRASKAREMGLLPLAEFLLAGGRGSLEKEAAAAVNPEKGVENPEAALAGARDILAEALTQDPRVRKAVREVFLSAALIRSSVKKGKEEEGAKFKDYFDWAEPAFKAPPHRIHAMLRGKNEGVLTLRVLPEEDRVLRLMAGLVPAASPRVGAAVQTQVLLALEDGYKRLLSKSMEKESLALLKQRADDKAIEVFSQNLRGLLLFPPLGQKEVLALDPGFRTGCKVACLDAQGKLLTHDLIFLHQPEQAKKTLARLIGRYRIKAVAVGNGTAGRETLALVTEVAAELGVTLDIVLTDESGASVYSASEAAREEFPDLDLTVRGAVSIGRRLMDPLAELVKIDPKAIGVGQYQHDVDPSQLKTSLDEVVQSCVNQVGVEVNTASKALLSRVSGLNQTVAANIVAFRDENGPFATRQQLLKVPRLGPKAFEQAAGFLRIRNGREPLDRSGIHPESYGLVRTIAKDRHWDLEKVMGHEVGAVDLSVYVTPKVGLPTLKDILKELANPGRDPRAPFQSFAFDPRVKEITDLVPGMVLPGIVTNVTAFGAFVDVGVHQDGLVHISQLADRFVKDPGEVVKVRQQVKVRVTAVDIPRKRISLSMKGE